MSNDTTHSESDLLDLLQEEGLGEGGQALGVDNYGQIVIYTGYRYVLVHHKGSHQSSTFEGQEVHWSNKPIPKVTNKRITKDIF